MIYPMSTEAAEIAHDLDYVEYVQAPEEYDAAFDEAAKDHNKLARWMIECDDDEPIAKMLRLLHRAEWIGTAAGDMHDKFRRELVGEMKDMRIKFCKDYAEAA